jgi:hypothetical protein
VLAFGVAQPFQRCEKDIREEPALSEVEGDLLFLSSLTIPLQSYAPRSEKTGFAPASQYSLEHKLARPTHRADAR